MGNKYPKEEGVPNMDFEWVHEFWMRVSFLKYNVVYHLISIKMKSKLMHNMNIAIIFKCAYVCI